MTVHNTILIIDDDPITRKLVRITLKDTGYKVIEAEDGESGIRKAANSRPDLVLLDLVLPDVDGLELAGRLRDLPQGEGLPIIILSGFLTKIDQARRLQLDFADYLAKPMAPQRLLQIVQAHLPTAGASNPAIRDGQVRHVLVAHDDSLQRKLLKLHLEQSGFSIVTAENGADALEQARRSPPDAILSDVLMPSLGGFELSSRVRGDPDLAHIPVILLSVARTAAEDQRQARAVGANALVRATPDFGEVKRALLTCLSQAGHRPTKSPPLEGETVEDRPSQRAGYPSADVHGAIRRLEHQTTLNVRLLERLTWLEAQVAVLVGSVDRLADMLDNKLAIEPALEDLLRRCLEASGAGRCAAYLVEPDGRFSLRVRVGFPDATAKRLQTLFGQEGVSSQSLQEGLAAGKPFLLPVLLGWMRDLAAELLLRPEDQALLIVPLRSGDELLGLLMFPWADSRLEEGWMAFINALEDQISQTIVLAQALSQLKGNKERLAQALSREEAARLEAESARERIANIFESITDGFFALDGEWRFCYVNRKAEQFLPKRREELIGKVIWEELPEAVRSPLYAEAKKVAAERVPAVLEVYYPPLNAWIEAHCYPAQGGLSVYFRDITERKRGEQERERWMALLQDGNEQLIISSARAEEQTEVAERWAAELDATFRAIGDAIVVYDLAGRIMRMNPAAEKMLGYSPAQRDLAVRDRIELLAVKTPEGQPYTLEHPLVQAVLEGETVSGIVGSLQLPDGRSIWVSGSAGPVRARDGNLLGIVACLTDITAERELHEQREDFIRAVSHDLRTPLSVILGHAQMIGQSVNRADLVQRSADAVSTSAKRMSKMIQDMVDAMRLDGGQFPLDMQPVDLGYCIHDWLARASGALAAERVKVDIQSGLLQVMADPAALERVVMNLLENALKYSPPETAIVVSAERNGGEITVSVSDQGEGIAPSELPHVFERFYRAPSGMRRAKGVGLGLYITKMLVEAQSGRIWVESEVGKGSTFYFTLLIA